MFIAILATLAIESSRLQAGTQWSGEEVLHFVNKESEIDETHRFKLSFLVKSSEDKAWVAERRSQLLGSRIADTDIPPPPDPHPAITTEWLSPAGFLLKIEPNDLGVLNLDRLIHFWLPVGAPDQWTADLTSTLDEFLAKGHVEFKLMGKAGGPSREYSFSYTSPEDPTGVSATGRMRFDVSTGRLLQAKLEAQRAVLPGSVERANVTLTYTDSQIAKPLD